MLERNWNSTGQQEDVYVEQATAKEYKISFVWGDLAIKEWGSADGIPVLGLHGWQDNAGTFDTLSPLLPSSIRFVCLDFAGHGLSPHYPDGMMYDFWDYLLHVRMIADQLGWEKFIIIGHSLGGIIGSVFTALFPERVESLITIDSVKPVARPAAIQPDFVRSKLVQYQKAFAKMENSQPPSYTFEEARDRLIQGHKGSLNKAAAEILMKRGVKKNRNGGYYFARDLRHTISSNIISTLELQKEFFSRIKCPLLTIKATEGLSEPPDVYEDFFREVYSKNCSVFKYVEVEGKHHVHLTDPEKVAPIISKFLRMPSNL